jgi:hypothetical protein
MARVFVRGVVVVRMLMAGVPVMGSEAGIAARGGFGKGVCFESFG